MFRAGLPEAPTVTASAEEEMAADERLRWSGRGLEVNARALRDFETEPWLGDGVEAHRDYHIFEGCYTGLVGRSGLWPANYPRWGR